MELPIGNEGVEKVKVGRMGTPTVILREKRPTSSVPIEGGVTNWQGKRGKGSIAGWFTRRVFDQRDQERISTSQSTYPYGVQF